MNPDEEERLDLAAAEYALGTMRGERAEVFKRRMGEDPALALRVRRWEARLAPPLEAYAGAPAPETLWAGIAKRAHGEAARPGLAAFWRRLAAACAMVAVVSIASLAWVGTGNARPQCYAVLVDDQARPIAVVFDRRDMRELVVLPVGSRLAGAQGPARLWIVAGGAASEVGIVEADGETRLALDKPAFTAVMAPGARLVIASDIEKTDTARVPGAILGDGIVALLGTAAPAKGS